MFDVAVVDIENDIYDAVCQVFENTVPDSSLLKSSGEVYLKPNGIDFKPYAYTSPNVLEAAIRYFQNIGASKVFVMENSTQANMTRIVFEFTGYKKICKKTGAKPVFLDEGQCIEIDLENFDEPIEFPRIIVEKFIYGKNDHTYVSLPKLKTHSMTTVTLGIKNQMAFPRHSNRGYHHNYNLHRRLADFYLLIQPDYTLIDGTHAVFNGHYPLEAFLSESIEKLDVLIGGSDTLATDVVGAKILGYDIDEVKHLTLVRNDGNSNGDLERISVRGDLSRFIKKYPCDIIDKLPEDVRIIRGKDLLCPEGCDLNVRMTLQMLYYDFGGTGGFSILMGKGFNKEELDSISGKVFIAGDCAISETCDVLEARLGKKNVLTSPTCNRLASTTTALCKLMGINVLDLVPSRRTAIKALLAAKLHGSKALIPDII